MKSIISLSASAAFVLGLAIPALAGSVGVDRGQIVTPYQAQEDLALLQNAQGQARVVAQENKNRPPYINRAHDLDVLVHKLQNNEPVSQEEVDQALQPINSF